MSARARKPTIKTFAHDLLVKTNFVDIHGRAVGYDYDYILARIMEQFPEARTTRRLVQDMAYIFNRTERLPVRRRSRRALAEDYAAVLLLRPTRTFNSNVRDGVKRKFPDQTITVEELKVLGRKLSSRGFTVPRRD